MQLYDLPQDNLKKVKAFSRRFLRKRVFWLVVLIVFVSSICGFLAGALSGIYFSSDAKTVLEKLGLPQFLEQKIAGQGEAYTPQTSQEKAVINAVKEASPAVVSIVIYKDVPIMEQYFVNPFEGLGTPFDIQVPQYRQKGTQRTEIGGGTGFIVSSDGLILTNKHVVADSTAQYVVFTNDGQKFDAKVLSKDPVQDLAVLKISQQGVIDDKGKAAIKPFPVVKLGDSDTNQIGQTVIAIGNALGAFRNTVSVGVISGLGRTISASGGGVAETLEDTIQTDAAINKGNSGGPLLNLKGEVIGINTAIAESAQSIGFAIPINKAKKDIEQVAKTGKIVYPFLGVRYALINEQIKAQNNLPVDYGAWVTGDSGMPAITPGSAAEKAGLKEKDIILEFNGEKITTSNPMAKIIIEYQPGDKITLKILRDKEEKTVEVILGERTE